MSTSEYAPNREIVSFRSCVRAGEAKLRERERDGSSTLGRAVESFPSSSSPSLGGLRHFLCYLHGFLMFF